MQLRRASPLLCIVVFAALVRICLPGGAQATSRPWTRVGDLSVRGRLRAAGGPIVAAVGDSPLRRAAATVRAAGPCSQRRLIRRSTPMAMACPILPSALPVSPSHSSSPLAGGGLQRCSGSAATSRRRCACHPADGVAAFLLGELLTHTAGQPRPPRRERGAFPGVSPERGHAARCRRAVHGWSAGEARTDAASGCRLHGWHAATL
jgi:hypothetical protein